MTLEGVDTSSYQGVPDWKTAHDKGRIRFAWVKASEGSGYVNPYFAENMRCARAAGIRVGAYHFAEPTKHTPTAEAEHFCKVAGRPGRKDLRPVLDYELTGLIPSQALHWIRAWNQEVKRRLGVWPIFYSYPALLDQLRLKHPVGDGLWLASYAVNDGREHPFLIPRPWRKVVAHQYSSNAEVPGFNGRVDVNSVRSLGPLLAHPILGRL